MPSSQIACQAKIIGDDAKDLTLQHPSGTLELKITPLGGGRQLKWGNFNCSCYILF